MFFLIIALLLCTKGALAGEIENLFDPEKRTKIIEFNQQIILLPSPDCFNEEDFAKSIEQLEKELPERIKYFNFMKKIAEAEPSNVPLHTEFQTINMRYERQKERFERHHGNLLIHSFHIQAPLLFKQLLQIHGLKDKELLWKKEGIENAQQKSTIKEYIQLRQAETSYDMGLPEYLAMLDAVEMVETKS